MPEQQPMGRMPQRKEVSIMPNIPRDIGPRFKVTDVVGITSFIHSKLAGQSAKVVGVRESRYAQTLDKYVLRLEGSVEQHTLWDIELKSI
jgi:hypothetical protein